MEKEEETELDLIQEFLLISGMKTVLVLMEKGLGKGFYMNWCEEIWDSVQMNNPSYLKQLINEKMKTELDSFIDSIKRK